VTITAPPTFSVNPRRLLRLTAFVLIVVPFLLGVIMPILLGAGRAWFFLRAPCGDGGATPAQYGLLNYKNIEIVVRGGTLRGFYLPGTTNGIILRPPAYTGGRDNILDEMAILNKHGYHVIMWESTMCSTRPSPVSLGYWEAQDVGDVLTYVENNPDNLPLPLTPVFGVHGFSAGGAAATLAMAQIPELGALVAEGGFHRWDALTIVTFGNTWLEGLFGIGGHLAYRLTTGIEPQKLDPLAAIAEIPPRPILLIYGELEPSLDGAKLQLAAVKKVDPTTQATLWIVPNGDHGAYVATVGEAEYAWRVLPFYDCALLKKGCPP
jgi:pimeloyl-ACP methyl ester carboxylesterase